MSLARWLRDISDYEVCLRLKVTPECSQHLEAPLHAQVLILNVYSMLIAFVLNYNLIIAHKYNLHRIYIKQWVNSSKFWSATGPRSEWYTLKLLPYWGLTNFKKFLYKVILGAMVETEYHE